MRRSKIININRNIFAKSYRTDSRAISGMTLKKSQVWCKTLRFKFALYAIDSWCVSITVFDERHKYVQVLFGSILNYLLSRTQPCLSREGSSFHDLKIWIFEVWQLAKKMWQLFTQRIWLFLPNEYDLFYPTNMTFFTQRAKNITFFTHRAKKYYLFYPTLG